LLALLAGTGRLQAQVAAGSIVPPAGDTLSLWQRLCQRLGERCQTVNLIGRLHPRETNATGPHLYLVAHSDTTALAGLAALTAGVPLLFLVLAGAGNASPGAIDNASGAALVVHLAEVLAEARPDVALTVLITGAEELGVVGATAYRLLAQRTGLLERQAEQGLYILNFDGIGGDGRLALVGGDVRSQLAAAIRASCVDLQLPLGRLPLVGALFDHVPFAEAGFDAVSLVTVGAAGRSVHTPADSVDKLDVEGFRQAGEVALQVVQRLSTRSERESPTSSGPAVAA
jgi:Zn-dependent M28 family amino/carboxypeptidase